MNQKYSDLRRNTYNAPKSASSTNIHDHVEKVDFLKKNQERSNLMANVQNLNRLYKAPPMLAPSMTDSDLNIATEQKSNEEKVVKSNIKV